jgi:hypothetical protein
MNTIQQTAVTVLLLLFFTSMFFSFTSCLFEKSKDEPCKHGDTPIHLLTDLDKSRISMYTGNDKLTFINTTTQQQQTYESKAVETYYVTYTESNIDQRCKLYKKKECKKIVFHANLNNDKLTLLIDYTPKSYYQHIYIHFKQNGYDDVLGRFIAKSFMDSVQIQNKTYYNIYKISTYGNEQSFDKWFVYYTLDEGIIRVKLINGEIWELIDKQ